MKLLKKQLLISSLFLSFSASLLADDCVVPAAPTIPKGDTATESELISAQKAMKGYQSELSSYRDCLTKNTAAIDKSAEGAEEKSAKILAAYNASVDSEASIAEQFNTAVRAFKAKK